MRILGIETSWDETSTAVVEETGDTARPWAICSSDRLAGADLARGGRGGCGYNPGHFSCRSLPARDSGHTSSSP